MKKFILCLMLGLLLLPGLSMAAGTKQDWLNAKQTSQTAQTAYHQAQLDYAADNSPANEQKVIETAKAVLNAALNEAQAWLEWKDNDAQQSTEAPADIKSNIHADVAKNISKIDSLKTEVAAIQTRQNVGIVFLKMIGSYIELLADVARNTGSMWIVLANNRVATVENYEAKMRTAAGNIDDNTEIISKLDLAKSELNLAKEKISIAETAYKLVKLPGTPLIKLSEGNNYLNQAKTNLLNAQAQLVAAFNLIISKK